MLYKLKRMRISRKKNKNEENDDTWGSLGFERIKNYKGYNREISKMILDWLVATGENISLRIRLF